jgi:Ricin-type beta-trefoil lectin domain-like
MIGNALKTGWVASSLALAMALGGCQPGADESPAGQTEDSLATTNGLSMLNGLSMTNGLSGNGLSGNGLSGNGLSGNGLLMNPLKTGILTTGSMMNTTDGRSTMGYIVRCALASSKTITAKDSTGKSYSFPGAIGVAPEWETGTCGTTCQERMTACLLAHVNTSGVHIPIWLDSESAIGWGQNTSYPFQEGSFFGNVFVNPPKGYFCNGKDFSSGTVPGRLGAGQSNAPYYDPFGTPGPCAASCTASSAKTNGVADGFTSCYGYTHVVTVWRNFDVNTQYMICNRQLGKCLEVAGSSTAAGAAVQHRTYSGGANQKWTITQISAGKYKLLNVASGKALDLSGGSLADGTALVQQSYSGAASQLWALPSLGDQGQGGVYTITPSAKLTDSIWPAAGNTNDGTPAATTPYTTADIQKWQITPL